MLVRLVASSKYRAGLRALEAGDLDALLRQFAPDARLTFVGRTPLGADGLTGPAVRAWFERFRRLLPDVRFEVRRLVVAGTPWRTQVAAHVVIRATVAGEPYCNQFAHLLELRRGKVVDDLVVEDTQRWAGACDRLVAAGVAEAAAPAITG